MKTYCPLIARAAGRLAALAAVVVFASCSMIFPHDRPEGPDYISAVRPVSQDLIDPDRPFEESRYLPRYTLNPGDDIGVSFDVRAVESEEDYKLQEGDEVQIKVLFHDEVGGDYIVRPDGKINLPYIGGLRIVGLTPEEAGATIANLYSDRYRDPVVTVQLIDTGQRIENLRQVFSSGLNQGLRREYSVGPDGRVNLPVVGEFEAVGLTVGQLQSIINSAYARMVPEVSVNVTLNNTQGHAVYVMGEVAEPGRYPITGPMTASRALTLAGGENIATADLSTCVLLQLDVVAGEATAQYVDLESVLRKGDISRDAWLGPNDVLVVPSTRIARMDRWVDQYVAKLFLFRGFGGNASYRLN